MMTPSLRVQNTLPNPTLRPDNDITNEDEAIAGFMEWVLEIERSSSFVPPDLVLYSGPFVGDVGGVGEGFFVWLSVRAAMGSSSFLVSLSGLGVGLGKAFCILRDVVIVTDTLGDGYMSDSVLGGGVDYIIGTLGDVCVFSSSTVCIKMWGCSVGAVVWAAGAWRLIRLLYYVASRPRSLIDVSPFPFDIPLADCSRFLMDLTNQSACVMVGFVICFCWNTTVSDTHSALAFLTRHT